MNGFSLFSLSTATIATRLYVAMTLVSTSYAWGSDTLSWMRGAGFEVFAVAMRQSPVNLLILASGLFAGLALMVGLKVRQVAFLALLAPLIPIAYRIWTAWEPLNEFDIHTIYNGFLSLAIFFTLLVLNALALVVQTRFPWSVDALLARNRAKA